MANEINQPPVDQAETEDRYRSIIEVMRDGIIVQDARGQILDCNAQADSSSTRSMGGTGLGLSIAKAIIENHGGKIGFNSKVGQGSAFFFELPICDTV